MKRLKTTVRILCILLTVLTFSSVILFSAKTEDSSGTPLKLEIALDKSRYFVTNNVKMSVTVRNISDKPVQDLIVCVYSDKHQLLFGNQSVFEAGTLDSSKSITFYSEMALNRNAVGLGLFDRILLFFTQLHKNYIPFANESDYHKSCVSESIRFKHGTTFANLKATVWYESAADFSETETTLQDYVSGTGIIEDYTTVPRPQVTYLDKYVFDIFKAGSFTLETETKEDGMTMPATLYEDADNQSIEVTLTNLMIQDLQLPSALSGTGKVRFIIIDKKAANPKAYIAWTGGYMEMENADEISNMICEIKGKTGTNSFLQLTADDLEYCGSTTGVGYVCESYKNTEENMQYNFYFTKTDDYEGIVRRDCVDLSTSQTDSQIVMRLTRGVTNKKAFIVEGQKTTMEDFEKMFGD